MAKNSIWIANDHGGYDLKIELCKHLRQKGIALQDIGADSTEIVRYPIHAAKVAGAISKGEIEGILICSTGIGMSIIANKFNGVRAALCTSTYMAKMTRAHNNSNVLCLGGKITGVFEAIDILDSWLATEYEGGRHDISLGIISEAEDTLCNPGGWTYSGD